MRIRNFMKMISGLSFAFGMALNALPSHSTDTPVTSTGNMEYPMKGNMNLDEGTFELWVKPGFDFAKRLSKDKYKCLVALGTLPCDHGNLIMYSFSGGMAKNNVLWWMRPVTKGMKWASSPAIWKKDEWHHIAFAWKGKENILYIDGELVSTVTQQKTLREALGDISDNPFIFGCPNMRNSQITIDDFRLSSVARERNDLGFYKGKLYPDEHTVILDGFDDDFVPDGKISTKPEKIQSGTGGIPSKGCNFVQGKFGNALALWDDPHWGLNPEKGYTIENLPEFEIIPLGKTYKLSALIKCPAKGQIPKDATIKIARPDGSFISIKASIGSNGKLEKEIPIHGLNSGLYRFIILVEEKGLAGSFYADIVSSNKWEKLKKAAENIKLKPGTTLLFTGDSLTDLDRGFNYVDKIGFFLKPKILPGGEIINTGIRGDTITGIESRLERDIISYKPDMVFIFIGHNDTKLNGESSGKEAPAVSLEQFEKSYRNVISTIQKETGAEVFVLAASSSDFDVCRERAEKFKRPDGKYTLFGKPEMLETYNETARKIAQELNAEYIDIYNKTKDHPDKKSLYRDGVHLTNKGNCFIAEETLEFLSEK